MPLLAYHGMVVDGKNEVGITGHRDEADSVTDRLLNVDDRKRGSGSPGIASESIDQRSIRY